MRIPCAINAQSVLIMLSRVHFRRQHSLAWLDSNTISAIHINTNISTIILCTSCMVNLCENLKSLLARHSISVFAISRFLFWPVDLTLSRRSYRRQLHRLTRFISRSALFRYYLSVSKSHPNPIIVHVLKKTHDGNSFGLFCCINQTPAARTTAAAPAGRFVLSETREQLHSDLHSYFRQYRPTTDQDLTTKTTLSPSVLITHTRTPREALSNHKASCTVIFLQVLLPCTLSKPPFAPLQPTTTTIIPYTFKNVNGRELSARRLSSSSESPATRSHCPAASSLTIPSCLNRP